MKKIALFSSSRMGYDEPPDMLDNQGANKWETMPASAAASPPI